MTSEHGHTKYIKGECRCRVCTDAHTKSCMDRRAVRKVIRIPRTVVHGRLSTYINWSCRCNQCTAANTEWKRNYVVRRGTSGNKGGTPSDK